MPFHSVDHLHMLGSQAVEPNLAPAVTHPSLWEESIGSARWLCFQLPSVLEGLAAMPTWLWDNAILPVVQGQNHKSILFHLLWTSCLQLLIFSGLGIRGLFKRFTDTKLRVSMRVWRLLPGIKIHALCKIYFDPLLIGSQRRLLTAEFKMNKMRSCYYCLRLLWGKNDIYRGLYTFHLTWMLFLWSGFTPYFVQVSVHRQPYLWSFLWTSCIR